MRHDPALDHAVREHAITIECPAPEAITLFTVPGERLWVPGWTPTPWRVGPDFQQAGDVFTTPGDGDDPDTVWYVEDYRSDAGVAKYVRVTPGVQLGVVEVRCTPVGESATEVRVRYTFTALSAEGRRRIAAVTPERFAAGIGEWRGQVQALLERLGGQSIAEAVRALGA